MIAMARGAVFSLVATEECVIADERDRRFVTVRIALVVKEMDDEIALGITLPVATDVEWEIE